MHHQNLFQNLFIFKLFLSDPKLFQIEIHVQSTASSLSSHFLIKHAIFVIYGVGQCIVDIYIVKCFTMQSVFLSSFTSFKKYKTLNWIKELSQYSISFFFQLTRQRIYKTLLTFNS